MKINKFILITTLCFWNFLFLHSTDSIHPFFQYELFETNECSPECLPVFHLNKGEDYMALGQFDEALIELYKGYEIILSTTRSHQSELELRALFMIMLAYACLGDEEMSFRISDYLQHLLENWKCESQNKIQLCKNENYVIGPEKEPYKGWCQEAVKSTAAALKGVVRGCRLHLAAKESLIFTIDKLQEKALGCCANGGLWKACVGPLAKKLHEWNMVGIPKDPMWD